MTLECVINVSVGEQGNVLRALTDACSDSLLDVHSDKHHNRSVLTLAGADVVGGAKGVAQTSVALMDIRSHVGEHPRIGVIDVVPFVPLDHTPFQAALDARDEFGEWMGGELGVPTFLYGPERTLPDIRRRAFAGLSPDFGPAAAHPTAGACAVGARTYLIAYNLWLRNSSLEAAREIAKSLRSQYVRALGLPVGQTVQVSINLIDPLIVGPVDVYDAVSAVADIDHSELVGLAPQSVIDAIPPHRYSEIGVDPTHSIEHRLKQR